MQKKKAADSSAGDFIYVKMSPIIMSACKINIIFMDIAVNNFEKVKWIRYVNNTNMSCW